MLSLSIILSAIAVAMVLLATALSWPVVLVSGSAPIAVLLICWRRFGLSNQVPRWPDQWALPAALTALTAMLYLRFLMSQSLVDIEIVRTPPATLWTIWLLGLLCGAAAAFFFRDCWGSAGIVAFYGVMSAGNFYAAYSLLDVQLDRGPPSIRSAHVTAKHVLGSGRAVHGTLTLEAFGRGDVPATYAGGWTIYEAIKVGDTVCFVDHRGAFGTPWRKVEACPDSERPSGRS